MRRRSKPGLIVDLFAGGGGASTGIEAALGRAVDVAVNHNQTALDVHRANHPGTLHLTASVWDVPPREVTRGRRVDLLWASPDCTHFSKAKGGKPRARGTRSLAWVVTEWARAVRPAVIIVENVEEFQKWGPVGEDGMPVKAREGDTFAEWRGVLEVLGYKIEYRLMTASHFGAPTTRKRLFIVGRCDGRPVRWPAPTHGPGRRPFHTAAECIDWTLPCPSIFERKKPLAEKTLWRIAQGIRRFVLESPEPFICGVGGRAGQSLPTATSGPIGTVTAKNDRALVTPYMVKVNHGGREARGEALSAPLSTVTATQRGHALVAPTMIQTGYGERSGQAPRVLDLHAVVVAQGTKQALVAAFLAKHYGGVVGQPMTKATGTVTTVDHHALVTSHLVKLRGQCHGADMAEPAPTITAAGMHVGEVRAFLTAYYSCAGDKGQDLRGPMRTLTTLDRLGLVMVEGVEHQIADIGMRMLEPHELLRAQFGRYAQTYDLSAAKTKAAKVRLVGNSVCPEVAEALVRANLGDAVDVEKTAA